MRTAHSLIAITLLTYSLSAGAETPSRPPANWVRHEYAFSFKGFTTTYSCTDLADKLRALLLSAGARPDVQSVGEGCSVSPALPSRFAQAKLIFFTFEPTNPGLDSNWERIAWQPRSPPFLHREDCELVEQFRRELLSNFTVRAVDNRTHCVPHDISLSTLSLAFDALMPAPAARGPAPGA